MIKDEAQEYPITDSSGKVHKFLIDILIDAFGPDRHGYVLMDETRYELTEYLPSLEAAKAKAREIVKART